MPHHQAGSRPCGLARGLACILALHQADLRVALTTLRRVHRTDLLDVTAATECRGRFTHGGLGKAGLPYSATHRSWQAVRPPDPGVHGSGPPRGSSPKSSMMSKIELPHSMNASSPKRAAGAPSGPTGPFGRGATARTRSRSVRGRDAPPINTGRRADPLAAIVEVGQRSAPGTISRHGFVPAHPRRSRTFAQRIRSEVAGL